MSSARNICHKTIFDNHSIFLYRWQWRIAQQHTQNALYFSIATMVKRTRYNVTLYVHCLSFPLITFPISLCYIIWPPDTKIKLTIRRHKMQQATAVSFIKKNPTRCKNISTFYYFIFVWSSTCFGRHIAHDRGLELHWQPLVFHTWRVVGRVVGGRSQAHAVFTSVV